MARINRIAIPSLSHSVTQRGISIALVAQRYSLNASLIFKWLRDPRFAPDEGAAEELVFLPVEVAPEPPTSEEPIRETALVRPTCNPGQPQPSGRSREIILANGHRIRVDGEFDGDGLAVYRLY